jgi:hypothetical protein
MTTLMGISQILGGLVSQLDDPTMPNPDPALLEAFNVVGRWADQSDFSVSITGRADTPPTAKVGRVGVGGSICSQCRRPL